MRIDKGSEENVKSPSASEDYGRAPEGQSTISTPNCASTIGCKTLETYLEDLQGRGLNFESIAIVRDQRLETCALAGRCTLYYGTRETALLAEPKDSKAYPWYQTTGY